MKAKKPAAAEVAAPEPMEGLHPRTAARMAQAGPGLTELSRRMVRIDIALDSALEARGHEVEAGTATVDGERIDFWLYEAGRHMRVALKPKEWGYRPGTTTWKQVVVPSGQPTLVAKPFDYAGGGQRRWTDGRQRIEDQIGRIVDRFEAIAIATKERRARTAQWKLEREAAMRRAAQRLRREQEREQRPENLHALVDDWHEAQGMRAFLNAMEKRLASRPPSAALANWLEWARSYVEAFDPLSEAGLEDIQAEAESIEWAAEDDGELDEDEQEWRDMGMLDEYM